MSRVVGFVLDVVARQRMCDSLAVDGAATFQDSPAALLDVVRRAPPAVAIVELRDAAGASTVPLIERLRDQFPSVAVVAYATPSPTLAVDIVAAARAGANGLVVRDFGDAGAALRTSIDLAEDHVTARRALAELNGVVAASVRPQVEYALINARGAPTVATLAGAFGMHRKTLVNRFVAAGLPMPRELINWCRLILAARLLEEPAHQLEGVAAALRFPSPLSLRTLLRRYTGLQPRDIRPNGGFLYVVRLLRTRLAGESPPEAPLRLP